MADIFIAPSLFLRIDESIRVDHNRVIFHLSSSEIWSSLFAIENQEVDHLFLIPLCQENLGISEQIIAIFTLLKLYISIFVIYIIDV
jgi:hypothetical protein